MRASLSGERRCTGPVHRWGHGDSVRIVLVSGAVGGDRLGLWHPRQGRVVRKEATASGDAMRAECRPVPAMDARVTWLLHAVPVEDRRRAGGSSRRGVIRVRAGGTAQRPAEAPSARPPGRGIIRSARTRAGSTGRPGGRAWVSDARAGVRMPSPAPTRRCPEVRGAVRSGGSCRLGAAAVPDHEGAALRARWSVRVQAPVMPLLHGSDGPRRTRPPALHRGA